MQLIIDFRNLNFPYWNLEDRTCVMQLVQISYGLQDVLSAARFGAFGRFISWSGTTNISRSALELFSSLYAMTSAATSCHFLCSLSSLSCSQEECLRSRHVYRPLGQRIEKVCSLLEGDPSLLWPVRLSFAQLPTCDAFQDSRVVKLTRLICISAAKILIRAACCCRIGENWAKPP